MPHQYFFSLNKIYCGCCWTSPITTPGPPWCPSTHTCNTQTYYTVAHFFGLSQQADLTSSRESASHYTTLPRPPWGLSTPHRGTSSIGLAAASLIIFSQDTDTFSCIVPFLITYGIHSEPTLSSTLFTLLIMILDSLILEYTPILLSSIYSSVLVSVYISNYMPPQLCLILILENLHLTHNSSFEN